MRYSPSRSSRRRAGGGPAAVERGGAVAGARLEALHELQGREELEDLLGPLGVQPGVLARRGVLAAAAAVEELGGQPLQRVAVQGGSGIVHRHVPRQKPTSHAPARRSSLAP